MKRFFFSPFSSFLSSFALLNKGKKIRFLFSLTLLGSYFLGSCFSFPAFAQEAQGIWIGTLKTEKGTCPTERPSTLVIRNDETLFIPGSGSLILKGTFSPDHPHYHAQFIAQGTNHKPFPMVFEGHFDQEKELFKGIYATPSCRANITLDRK
ncbi:hypothetical protein [Entomobacter blattae]|uniref:Uncharacterized protein n=1 Tax=Entomobacter blattae TaxID=2762277 RepID=A0A7H1NNL1_9PROT|nr:hypothetical protein [Entomobacter blattae]QNT77371.1 hypothetical protein JGUZn3_01040 [Entomobacter blattae]